MQHLELLRKVVSQIELSFPMVYLEVETIAESDEIFLVVDSMEVYESAAYQTMVARLKSELLWPNGVFNVFFGVSEARRPFVGVRLDTHATYSYAAFSLEVDAHGHDERMAGWVSTDLSVAA